MHSQSEHRSKAHCAEIAFPAGSERPVKALRSAMQSRSDSNLPIPHEQALPEDFAGLFCKSFPMNKEVVFIIQEHIMLLNIAVHPYRAKVNVGPATC